MTRSRLIVVALLIATSALAVALLFRGTRRGDVPSQSNVAVSASTSAPAPATRTPATSVTTTAGASDERPTEQLISELRSSDWPTVWLAALALEAKGKRAIPPLIELLGSDEFVKLKNTADLIYPGATETYGHGFLIEYDLDWIAVRAGWVIEAITFQAFGYRQTPFRMKDGTENVAEAAKVRAAAGDRVREWWSSSSSTWTRLAGLLDGLRSGDAPANLNLSTGFATGERAARA